MSDTAVFDRKPHELKSWPDHFSAIYSGAKTFELRRADRDFRVGDVIVLKEWNPKGHTGEFTGRELRRRIRFIMRGKSIPDVATGGLLYGYCIMGLDEWVSG